MFGRTLATLVVMLAFAGCSASQGGRVETTQTEEVPGIYADFGFLNGKIGPMNLTESVLANLSKSEGDLVLWPGPDPKAPTWKALIGEINSAVKDLEARPDLFRLVRSASDLADIGSTDLVYVIMTVQNPALIGDKWGWLDDLRKAGVRVIQLSYWGEQSNIYGSGFMSKEDRGLTPLGRRYLQELASRGFILDLAHLGPRTAMEAAELYTGSIMISHTGARSVYDCSRNANDDVMERVVKNGGIIGIYAMSFFLDAKDNSIKPWLSHIKHVINLVGPEHVTFGSDAPVAGFDDLTTAEKSFAKLTQRLDSAGKLAGMPCPPRWPAFTTAFNGTDRFRVAERALNVQFGQLIARGIMGINTLNFYRNSLPRK